MKTYKNLRHIVLFIFFCLTVSGCRDYEGQSILENKLMREFNEKNVSVKIKYGLWIRIHFINKKYLHVEEKLKRQKAKQVLKFVENNYDKIDGIKEVIVVLESYENDIERLKHISEVVHYVFLKKDDGSWEFSVVNNKNIDNVGSSTY
jgi:uncharacterized lipoprotein YehR (DUF1307 family)